MGTQSTRWALLAVVAFAVIGLLLARQGQEGASPAHAAESLQEAADPAGSSVRWVALGGGAEPSSNQVSIAQDLAQARDTLGGDGVLLFAGGPGSWVQLDDGRRKDGSLRRRLGAFFDPRPTRDSRYRRTELEADGVATPAHVVAVIGRALADPAPTPLLLYVAGHGEQGERPRDNLVRLWGGGGWTVADVAALLEESPAHRQVRMVLTSCFSGGFADLAFRSADPALGAAETDRCVLAATAWDLEASGCDPDPDRRVQEGYALHFLGALRRRDRHGGALERAEIDFDGDGRVSLLEAHTRARIASRSIDVPTTSSEVWLRHVASAEGPEADVSLPEEQAVIAALGRELGLAGLGAAEARLAVLESRFAETDRLAAERQGHADERWRALRIALLARWPVLEDPWHPDFAGTLEGDPDAIAAVLERSDEARAYRKAQSRVEAELETLWALELELARVERLVRAHHTLALARRLAGAGGPGWEHYRALLACERSLPP